LGISCHTAVNEVGYSNGQKALHDAVTTEKIVYILRGDYRYCQTS